MNMKKINPWKMILLVTMSLSLFTACSSQGKDTAGPAADPSSKEEKKSTDAPPEPLGKYPETVTVTEVLGYNPPEDPRTPKGITPDQNAYLKDLKDMLNIEVKYKWTVPSSQFEQKFSLAMASADLPDIMELDQKNFEKLKKQGMLADLTEAYNDYASPELKKYMESDGGFAMKTFTEDGKLLAIPAFEDPFLSTQLLWLRKDWLENLKLEPPKTMDELDKVAQAFVKNDPDQNGQNDTYGVSLQKNLFFWAYDLRGFFNGFGAYPSIGDNQSAWIKDSSGKLIPGLIQPIAIQIPGLDGPGKSLVPKIRSGKVYAVNKKMKNPEAAIKMINFYIEKGKKKYMEQNKAENGYVYNWFNPRIYNPAQIETIYTEVNKALDAKQTEITLDDENYKNVADVFKATQDYLAGNTANASKGVNWGQYFSRAAKDGGWGMTRQIKESGAFVNNEFFGLPTETQIEKGAQLDKLMQESFTKIIMGGSLDEFDKFVQSWKSLGGDQITQEVNDWYSKQAAK